MKLDALVVDLTTTTYLDSTGIALLFGLADGAPPGAGEQLAAGGRRGFPDTPVHCRLHGPLRHALDPSHPRGGARRVVVFPSSAISNLVDTASQVTHDALEFAAEHHEGQRRESDDAAFILHPLRGRLAAARPWWGGREVVAAGGAPRTASRTPTPRGSSSSSASDQWWQHRVLGFRAGRWVASPAQRSPCAVGDDTCGARVAGRLRRRPEGARAAHDAPRASSRSSSVRPEDRPTSCTTTGRASRCWRACWTTTRSSASCGSSSRRWRLLRRAHPGHSRSLSTPGS